MSKGTLIKSFVKGITNNGSGGGNIGTGDYNVKVIDYDGTIIAEKNLDEGKTFTLPKAPSHDGLVFQEWSSTQDITDGKITVGKSDVMIGAIYTTASGKNEFDFELNAVTGLSVTLNLDGEKDWGDGSTPDTLTSHTYSQAGKYTVKCDGTTLASALFGQSNNDNNFYCTAIRIATITTITSNFGYCGNVSTVILSKSVTALNNYSFRKAISLQFLVIPNSVTFLGTSVFVDCYCLSSVVIPANISSIGIFLFQNCRNLTSMVLSNITSIPNGLVFACAGLRSIKIPKTVTSVGTEAFSACSVLTEYDFSKLEEIPTLANTNAFNGINKIAKIKVPSALYDEWVAETNWLTYADYIVAV